MFQTGFSHWEFFDAAWITTEKALIWYIPRPIPMITGGSWFGAEHKKKLKHPKTKFLCIFQMVGTLTYKAMATN